MHITPYMMKRLFLLSALLIVSFAANSHGKSSHYGKGHNLEKVKFGVRGGLNIVGWETNKAFRESLGGVYMDLRSGVYCNLYGEYGLTDAFGVQLALMYTEKGSKFRFNNVRLYHLDDHMVERALRFDFDYISLSPSLRMYTGKDRQFCIFLGCSFAVLVRAKAQVWEDDEAIGDSTDFLSKKIPEEGRPKRFDMGIIYGLDYEFDTGILLGFSVDSGFTQIFKRLKSVKESQQPKVENRTVQLWIGYNFAKLFH